MIGLPYEFLTNQEGSKGGGVIQVSTCEKKSNIDVVQSQPLQGWTVIYMHDAMIVQNIFMNAFLWFIKMLSFVIRHLKDQRKWMRFRLLAGGKDASNKAT